MLSPPKNGITSDEKGEKAGNCLWTSKICCLVGNITILSCVCDLAAIFSNLGTLPLVILLVFVSAFEYDRSDRIGVDTYDSLGTRTAFKV